MQNNQSLSVLVVDDEIEILSLLQELLELRGFHITTAERGKDAIELAQKHSYFLVLADLKMPGINGVELIKRLRRIQPEAKIIVMSGLGFQIRQDLGKVGIEDYIIKPIDIDKLFSKIDRLTQEKDEGNR